MTVGLANYSMVSTVEKVFTVTISIDCTSLQLDTSASILLPVSYIILVSEPNI
jgi:hypothetical protein